jgi:phage gp36-like protein
VPSYCEPEDLGRYAINREALDDRVQEEDIQPAIDSASAEMDDYFRARFTLPLITWSDSVKRCCAVLAAYIAMTTRGWKPGENPEDSPLVMEVDYYRKKWLPGVSGGTVHPGVTDSSSGGAGPGGVTGRPMMVSNEQRGFFSEDPSRALPFQGRRR